MKNDTRYISIIINSKILLALRPENILIISLSFLLIAFIIAPITINNTLTFDSITYLVLSFCFFLLGTQLIKSKKKDNITIVIGTNKLCKIYNLSFYIGALGVFLKYIDLFLFRNLSFDNSLVENQEFSAETGGSIYSILAAMLIYFSFIPITIDAMCPLLNSKVKKLISFIIFLLVPLSTLLFGSRFGIIIPCVYFFILAVFTEKIKIKFNAKFIIVIVVISLVFSTIISNLFLKRLEEMGITGLGSISGITGGYADKVPASDSYVRLMDEYEYSILFPYLFAYANINQYVTHAILEFPEVKSYIDDNEIQPTYGKSTFFVFYKFFEKFTDPDISVTEYMAKANPRNGIWSTFFFYWYLDFRWFGIFLMILLGYVMKKIWAMLYYKLDYRYIPIVIYMPIIVFLMPQLNYLSGTTCYVLTAFFSIPLFIRK